jgi:hypothetical protein
MAVADRRPRFIFDVAGEGDDAELRSLFRNIPMHGAIRVAFEREPNFFTAAAIQGDFHQVGIVRERATQKIVGMGTRSVGRAFLNGRPSPLGYLCDLRLDPNYRAGTLVARGYHLSVAGRWWGFQIGDFYVAQRSGKVIGVIGKWDQRAFKQTRVLGYSRSLRWFRPLANAAHPLLGTPRFPEPGEAVPYFYLSFVAVDDDALAYFVPYYGKSIMIL